jgi:DNA-directed RNA polymerase specialized sigma24 family protein
MSLKTIHNEQELVLLLKRKDEYSFNYLYDMYSGALYGFILPIVHDMEMANDVLSQVFVNIWNKADAYEAASCKLFTWMLKIALNTARQQPPFKISKNEPA